MAEIDVEIEGEGRKIISVIFIHGDGKRDSWHKTSATLSISAAFKIEFALSYPL